MRFVIVIFIIGLLTGCGEATPTVTPAPAIQAVLAGSTLSTGLTRLPVGLVVDGTPINDPEAEVLFRFYYLDNPNGASEPVGETQASYYGQGLPAGVYVAYPEFSQAGTWAVDVVTRLPGMEQPSTSRLRLNVVEQELVPALGSPAIRVETPTGSDASELEKITSDGRPNPSLYAISLDQALTNERPTAVLFATPGFCRTATCGPGIQVLSELQATYGEQMDFIHIEVYAYPFSASFQANPPRFSAAMQAWNLPTEPWLFLIDGAATIRARYEGGITRDEIEPVVQLLIDEETN